MEDFHGLLCQLEQYPRPLVCAVKGYAVGAGFELVLHSDYIVATSQSRFGFPEINHGLLPSSALANGLSPSPWARSISRWRSGEGALYKIVV
jgi:enoyl-CoA hydratase/carnithine racemase